MNTTNKQPRIAKTWWVTTGSTVVQSEGLDCLDPDGNRQDGAWWFPKLGFTAFEGGSIFEEKEDAKRALIKDLEGKISSLQHCLDKAKAI